jgi:small subunit ribosomal protein S19e
LPTIYNIPAEKMIERIVEYLKDNVPEVTPPPWGTFVKTGSYRENPPRDPNWWYIRSASLLRKIYKNGPIGIARLRKEYGGRSRKGNVGKHKKRGGAAIIRSSLQQLEKAGLIQKVEKKGRIITNKGRALLDSLATEIQKRLEKDIPELKKYR